MWSDGVIAGALLIMVPSLIYMAWIIWSEWDHDVSGDS